MYSKMGEAIGELLKLMAILLVLSVPLAIWKLIDIIIWVCKHLSLSWR